MWWFVFCLALYFYASLWLPLVYSLYILGVLLWLFFLLIYFFLFAYQNKTKKEKRKRKKKRVLDSLAPDVFSFQYNSWVQTFSFGLKLWTFFKKFVYEL